MVNLIFNRASLPSVAPFTVPQGAAFLEVFEALRVYVQGEFVDSANVVLQEIGVQLTEYLDQMESQFTELGDELNDGYTSFTGDVNTLVQSINNRVGSPEVQHITLNNDQLLTIDPHLPDNHVLVYEVENTGNFNLTLPENITGKLFTLKGNGVVTRFTITPVGGGQYTLEQVLPSVVNALEFGVIGDGVTDDGPAMQVALNAAEGKTLLIPAGDYAIGTYLRIRNGCTVSGYGATLHRLGMYGLRIINLNDGDTSTTKYNGPSNITILGLTVNAHSDTIPDGPHNMVSLVHGENFTVRDCTFLNANGHHTLEINASQNVVIANNKFLGHLAQAGFGPVEAIQIDHAATGMGGLDDKTMCRNVLITGNVIGASDVLPANPVGIGAHSIPELGYFYENITISHNTITGCGTSGIRAYYFTKSAIIGNKITGVGPEVPSTQGILSRCSNYLKISDNVVNMVLHGISLSRIDDDGGYANSINGNMVENTNTGIYVGLNGRSHTVVGNTTHRSSSYGIIVEGAYYAHVASNLVSWAGMPNGAAGAIRLSGSAKSPSVVGNRVTKHFAGGGVEVSAGVSVDATVDQAYVYGNDFYGLGTAIGGSGGVDVTSTNRV